MSRWIFLVLLAAVTTACGSDSTAPVEVLNGRVASVEYIGSRAALFVDRGTGERTRIHFTGATDDIPANSPFVPPFRDENALAIGPLAWSPDGQRLALVATLAADQSQLIVMNGDGTSARVASVNSQIILSGPDWSPDGTRLLHAMSTQPHALGVEVFLTDLTTNRVQQLTFDRRFNPLWGTLRFGSTGAAIYYARAIGEGGAPLFEKESEIWRMDLATGAVTRLTQVTGRVQAIARSGEWALVLTRKAQMPNGDFDDALVRVPLDGRQAALTLIDGGRLHYARLTSDDKRVLVVRDESSTLGQTALAYYSLPATGGTLAPVRGTSAATVAAALDRE